MTADDDELGADLTGKPQDLVGGGIGAAGVHEEVDAVLALRALELGLDLDGEHLLHARGVHRIDADVARDARDRRAWTDHAEHVQDVR